IFASGRAAVDIPGGGYEWSRYEAVGTLAPKRRISGEISSSVGGFYGGHLRTSSGTLLLKPFSVLTLQLTTERNVATLQPNGFTQYLHGMRTEIKVSPELQVTNFLQYDNESR